MTFDSDHCFLCGAPLGQEKSAEHVFPKWLLEKYDLWNRNIVLLNGTAIPYRDLTIPCCQSCNSGYLSRLENEICSAVEQGYDVVRGMDELRLFQWLAKLFYGILFRELSLNVDRSTPSKGTIIAPDVLENYATLHAFLQSTRKPFEFVGFHPWSIFVVKAITYGGALDFDFRDNLVGMTIAVRMNGVGILACLEDSGTQQAMFEDYFADLEGVTLHPEQFMELAAKMAYKNHLLNRVPTYAFFPQEGSATKTYVVSPGLQGFSSDPVYDEWDPRRYAEVLADYRSKSRGLEVRIEDVYQEGKGVLTYLSCEDGSIPIYSPDGSTIIARKERPNRVPPT
jgi:hypothetical protein